MEDWLDHHLKQLNLVDTMKQPNGYTRLGYTEAENKAIQEFKRIAESLDLSIREDVAGNVIARWESVATAVDSAVAVGSHLDTVIEGGGYDGTAGILCGLGAVKLLQDRGFVPKRPIEIICFRSEESARFGVSTIGSKAIAGILDSEIGTVVDSKGTSIAQAVQDVGFDWSKFPKAERQKQEIGSFVELHIEQGTLIEESGKNFGVVHGVACPIRLKVTVSGKAGHTGTTPMDKRQDALVAIAPLVPFVSKTAKEFTDLNQNPVVATVSTMELKPNAMNVIPSKVEAGIDIRSVDDGLKKEVEQRIRVKCEEINADYQVTVHVEKLVDNQSVHLDSEVQKKLAQAGERAGYSSLSMNSGAGHDVMNIAQKWPAGLIFIPCKDGVSHHPDEHATLRDLQMGVELIASYLTIEAGD
ncbi:M20 family metallo-hydrolase [Alkalihalobacillus sp. AL-G]|uniref:M20 family metallo-hydrolase n=1 Tax=Alkalihalobacillus sp. AL-G TaxID=2926399 RepID=UPI00272B3680|nr:M20 family metallo-hydrolase [Alkalihalobacillus sp. AL-G]WLD93592.1 M20 family metallo-hydrolase [Alkalihalobacillus sp. AL-G]